MSLFKSEKKKYIPIESTEDQKPRDPTQDSSRSTVTAPTTTQTNIPIKDQSLHSTIKQAMTSSVNNAFNLR
ncbi:hypothetical protein BX616_011188 [Lobosporangium transversale]|uniref:Uncharacterized protein n=1 Tax=Lobosporangium transversale TaxID=64571 RepID=A0A1Y2GS26_9FUNG|nr:hypothetical protein BCR41DRAFT_351882 [Lobosporangium transversale]KAF9909400.1 hypothetical protein BX616_011188 [Lobosporangium transversale]ORZ19273.1 hypothetical protein BCR41DRAFT_351882 [Lobosporangium transversale]|eukprot:XP_021882441.1 hypothetical protein BCR41DRAFT_351882 [Lobosporangium transversale]